MIELGKYLKKQREKQGLSLEDLAARTKIHIQKLIDIESGNREALPARVFCIGLVKSYARELKLDMNEVDRLCRDAFEENSEPQEVVTPPPQKSKITPEKTESEEELTQPVGRFKVPKSLMIGASLVLIISLIIGIVQVMEKMSSYSKEEELPEEIYTAIDESDSPSELEEEIPAPIKEADKPKEIAKAESEKPSEPTTPVEKPEPKPEEKKPEPTPEPEPTQVAAKPVKKDFVDDQFGGPVSEPAAEKVVSDNKLTVTALEPVRAEVVWSDGYVQVMLLKSQESKTLVFSQPITLRINNGGAVQVSYNEGEKKVPGTFNQPIEIKYP